MSSKKSAYSKHNHSTQSKSTDKAKAPKGWEEALTPEEFLSEAKKIIRLKLTTP